MKDSFDELVGKATESIFVGNHNFSDISAHCSVQKTEETGPFPIESGGDVGNDLVLWIIIFETLDLSFKIGALFLAGDASIADESLFLDFFAGLVFRTGEHTTGDDIGEVGLSVKAFPTFGGSIKPDALNFSSGSPPLESSVADVKPTSDIFGGNKCSASFISTIQTLLWLLIYKLSRLTGEKFSLSYFHELNEQMLY